ncbi:MAG: saccharopine dehydrogenase NADP-binding domain-containing protein [Chitinophagaceae bacterium]|nr:saccharopine dehydrogenase NADP-binding domain-containing protein [Chitinophagaceae bacterium]
MMRIAVLGAGMVGRAIALDLANNFQVTSFDFDSNNRDMLKERNSSIEVAHADLRKIKSYESWLKPFDLVVTAVPGFMGFECLKAVIECGKNVADISFFPEDVLQLDALAKQKKVTVITDIGVAPGMSNLILGRHNEEMQVSNFECYVGGLPLHPEPPFFYKAPFSPIDVIEEYLRPARLQEGGAIVTRPALTQREFMDFTGVGKLEAFNTDGLRSLLFTMKHIPEMKEKTLRYPGHLDIIIALKEAGFFSEEVLEVGKVKIAPLQFSSRMLIDNWKLGTEEEELTVMRVIVEGTKEEKHQRIEYDLLDHYNAQTKTSSMARTTGYTCAAAANLIANGLFVEKGVFPPELVGKHNECFDFVWEYLGARGVIWRRKYVG